MIEKLKYMAERPYHNCQLSTVNCQLFIGYQLYKLESILVISKKGATKLLPFFRNYTVGWLAASMMATNFSGTREAPPIRPPSISG